MGRTILTVNATQVVVSQANPLGIKSVMDGYPKDFDSSRSPYNGDLELTMKAAKAEYYDRLSKNYADTNANRVMKTVTLETANGVMKMSESVGYLPSEPEPEEEVGGAE